MRSVLDERVGVPVTLVDGAFGLIVVEVNVVLQRAGVLGPHDLHALSGHALELLELALVKLESSNALKLTHRSGLRRIRLHGLERLSWPAIVPLLASARIPEIL